MLIGIIMALIMVSLGLFIASKITHSERISNDKYNNAVKIRNTELLQYYLKTGVGNAFIYGELKAIDAVSNPDIDGKYLMIKIEEENYTMHTGYHHHTVGKISYTTPYTYHTWDYDSSMVDKAKDVMFCGVKFKTEKFSLPDCHLVKTVYKSDVVRYKYYVYPEVTKGTIFSYITKGDIKGSNHHFYQNKDAFKTCKSLLVHHMEIVFWIVWVVLMISVICGYWFLINENY
jgi:hypothetical protein